MPGPWILFLGMVTVAAGLPLWFAAMRPPRRTVLLYGHLGLLQLLRGFLSVTYVMPLTGDLTISPGSVMYAATMMTAVLIVLVERRTAVLRSVVLVLLGTEAIKLAVFATTRWALGSPEFVNLIGIDPGMFSSFLRISGVGNLLIIAELTVVVALLEQLRRRIDRPKVLSLWCVVVFCLTVVGDGLLFPAVTAPLAPDLVGAITAGVARKAVLAVAFGVPLLGFVLLRAEPMARHMTTSLRLRDVLFAPRRDLVARLRRQERERVALLDRTLHVAEEERSRIAGDLHDDAIQLMTAADIRLQRLAASSPDVDIEPVRRLVRDGVDSLRRVILQLHGPAVTATAFEPLVRSYADRLAPNGEIEFDLTDVDLPGDLPGMVVGGAYRIVLEAVCNAVRHARADRVTIDVHVEDGMLVGEVLDDGIGIPDEAETGPGHLGLRAMRERADVLRGEVEVSRSNPGTRVAFVLPLEVDDELEVGDVRHP